LLVRKRFGDVIDEILRGYDVFGISAIFRIARERWVIAQVLRAGAAVFARTIGVMQPRYTHACALAEAFGVWSTLFDDAYDLMPRYDRHLAGRKFALDDVQIRAAHAAGAYAYQNFTAPGPRNHNLGEIERLGLHVSRRTE
jgi:hypothetical protein